MMVISWLSLTPAPPVIEDDFFGWDKFQHTAAYVVLTLLAGWAFGTFSLDLKRRWRMAVVAAVSFGGLMEIAQGLFTTQRTAEWGDLLADLVAAAGAYGLIMILRPLHNYIKPAIMSYRRIPDRSPGQAPVSSIIKYFLDSCFHRNDE